MSNYLLSFIIPVYNNESTLNRTFNSIFNQSIGFNNLEVVFIDDKSTDNSKSILKNFEKKYENCKCICLEENTGTPNIPRNIGIKSASSEYVLFLDADDYVDIDFCKILYEKIVQTNRDVVSCSYNEVFGDTKKPREEIFQKEVIINPLKCEKYLKRGKDWWMPWDKIYRRSFLIENNIYFPEKVLAEDVIFNLKILLIVEDILFINQYHGYDWIIYDDSEKKSLSHEVNIEMINKFLEGYQIIFNMLKDKEEVLKILSEEFISSLYFDFCKLNSDKKSKIDILNRILKLEKSIEIKLVYNKVYYKIFHYLLYKKLFNLLMIYSKILYLLIILKNL